MRVENEVPHAAPPIVPGRHALKGIVEGDSDVGAFEVAPAVHVELLYYAHVERGAHWLVQKLN